MRYFLLALLAASVIQTSVYASDLKVLKSVQIDLPSDDRQFAGDGADVVNNNCLACHSAGMVLNQPRFSREMWSAEVSKMSHVYKAPISEADATRIVEYLVAHFGPR